MRTHLILSALIVAVCMPLFTSCHTSNASTKVNKHFTENIIQPPYLHIGDSIGAVVISSDIDMSVDSAQSLLNRIRRWGFKIRLGKYAFSHTGGWFPASDKERASDLQTMIDDPNIRAVIFFRGGYGAIRTLDYLNLQKLRKDPKWLVGFSDLTILHAALRTVGVESIHGAMPNAFNSDSISVDSSALSMRDALMGKITSYTTEPSEFNQYGTAEGQLVGGNLTLIANAGGADVENDYSSPSILLIEDVDEQIYATDRRLQMLKRNGKLSRIKGLLVGHFNNTTKEDKWGTSVYELIHQYAAELNIPVIFNFPAGHIAPNYSLYMSRKVKITVDAKGGKIEFL